MMPRLGNIIYLDKGTTDVKPCIAQNRHWLRRAQAYGN
jgi:hypothetical protein